MATASTTEETIREFVSTYTPFRGTYDELRNVAGEITPGYQRLFESLNTIGRDEFSRRWQRAERTIQENGAAYSGHSRKSQRTRAWKLDAIPFLLDSKEWDEIASALQQRARLLNLVMHDLYGTQTLVRDGVLPPALIHSDPNFHRHFIGHTKPEESWLHLYAADIARTQNGKWWVLADRTDAPSGFGYALEHRIISSRLLPEAFRDCRIRRLAPFFVALQDSLRRLASHDRDNPRTVLLSDGPENPFHLEDAYLARYLGYTLAEDDDLAVRSGRTMLKTLGGLQRIDVILRHQNSVDSDPLVHNSVHGVAGLNQSVRAQEVAIANRLGSGLVESPAYMAFMPRLFKTLLDEKPLMHNVATWWCGEEEGLQYVLANLDQLIVQPAFRQRGRRDRLREQLRSMPKQQLAALIRANPRDYAAQEKVDRSSIATWGRKLGAEKLAMRCYAVANQDNNYEVMDGGLCRVTAGNDPLEVTIRKSEKSKDVWILSDTPVAHVSLLGLPESSQEVRRSGADLPSRVADDLFWLGRRLERAENHARLVNVTLSRLVGETPIEDCPEISMLMKCLATGGLIESSYAVEKNRETLPDIQFALPRLIFDDSQRDSFRGGLEQLVRLGSRLRDRLSLQAWKTIQSIDDGFRAKNPERATASDLIEMTDSVLMHLAAISGIVMESMTRSQVVQFLDLGRRIERSQQLITFLIEGITDKTHVQNSTLTAILELADSLMTYRSRYLANMHPAGVADLLITDEANPRSLAYQFVKAQQHIEQLPAQTEDKGYTPEQRVIMSLVTNARMFDLDDNHRVDLRGLSDLGEWKEQIKMLSRMISHRYLVHASSPHQLSDIDTE